MNRVTVAMKVTRKNMLMVMKMMTQVKTVKVKIKGVNTIVMTHFQMISCKHVHAVYAHIFALATWAIYSQLYVYTG